MQDWSVEHSAQVTEELTPLGWVRHLRVKRRDGKDGIPWDVLQAIKDELLGEDVTAVEFYPARYDLVNQVNMRHLYTIEPGWLPFGLHR
jgi:hypothetical protein